MVRNSWIIAPFISVSLWGYGFYLGCKMVETKEKHRSLDSYGKWMHEDEFGTTENPGEFLQPSATMRITRWV